MNFMITAPTEAILEMVFPKNGDTPPQLTRVTLPAGAILYVFDREDVPDYTVEDAFKEFVED